MEKDNLPAEVSSSSAAGRRSNSGEPRSDPPRQPVQERPAERHMQGSDSSGGVSDERVASGLNESQELVASGPVDATKDMSSGGSSTGFTDGERLPLKKSTGPKKDRSNLRKGKWTVEEEEYTSRIIHYFSTGLLTLPEGATLRSYLADKLNCDPMRITKKYSGASCLGRRIYHFHDRPQPTIAEIQLAKAELDHLEYRFRMRVEEGHTGLPLPQTSPSNVILLPLLQQANQAILGSTANANAPNAFQALLLNLAASQAAAPLPAAPQPSPVSAALWSIPGLANAAAAAPSSIFLQNTPAPVPVAPQVPFGLGAAHLGAAPATLASLNFTPNSAPALGLNPRASSGAAAIAPNSAAAIGVNPQTNALLQNADASTITNLMLALAPAVSQLAQATRTPTAAVAQTPTATVAQATPAATIAHTLASNHPLPKSQQVSRVQDDEASAAAVAARELKAAFEQHIQSQGYMMQPTCPPPKVPTAQEEQRPSQIEQQSIPASRDGRTDPKDSKPAAVDPTKPRTDEDKAAGTILLGFLSSLRQSYEEAIREKERIGGQPDEAPVANVRSMIPESSEGGSGDDTSKRPYTTVTESSYDGSDKRTDPSSCEDSDKELDTKKHDPSSSEDSDKEIRGRSRGPPRKRLKSKKRGQSFGLTSC